MVVLNLQKVPLQGFSSVPAGSVMVFFCNIEVNLQVMGELQGEDFKLDL